MIGMTLEGLIGLVYESVHEAREQLTQHPGPDGTEAALSEMAAALRVLDEAAQAARSEVPALVHYAERKRLASLCLHGLLSSGYMREYPDKNAEYALAHADALLKLLPTMRESGEKRGPVASPGEVRP